MKQESGAALNHRRRGLFRFFAGVTLGILASFLLLSKFGLSIAGARAPGALDLKSILLLAIIVFPCVLLSWGLHGIVTGKSWNRSGFLVRLIFVVCGCVLGMFAVFSSKAGLDLWASSYYRDNARFSILRDYTLELKGICYPPGLPDELRDCLARSQPRLEEMKRGVEELVKKYPALKNHDVSYSSANDPDQKTAEVFSYSDFIWRYELKMERAE
jgi:hypothetical protein